MCYLPKIKVRTHVVYDGANVFACSFVFEFYRGVHKGEFPHKQRIINED